MRHRLELWDKDGVPLKEIDWAGPPPPTFYLQERVGPMFPSLIADPAELPSEPPFRKRAFQMQAYVQGTSTVLYREYP